MTRANTSVSESLPPVDRSTCAVCAVDLTPGNHYVVRIDIFADPGLSEPASACDNSDPATQLAEVIAQMKSMSAEELQDRVHRRFEYSVCAACQRKLLANPLGLPRTLRNSSNKLIL